MSGTDKMEIRKSTAVSHGYCVREFDRSKAQADPAGMLEEQKMYDIHFTGVAYDPRYPVVWCGFTSFAGDLLWTFDPVTKQFESKRFTPLREPQEVKIHRGLQVGPDGRLYFGTAALVNVPQRYEAPGGRLFCYDPAKDQYEFLGRPVANDYIQNIDVDYDRGIIYGGTYPLGQFFAWDIEKQKLLCQAFIADWPHQVCVDDDGNCWCTYNAAPESRDVRLLKYDVASGKLIWTEVALPGDAPKLAAGIDSFVNGHDGFLYIGTSTGALVRLNPRKTQVDFLLKPSPSEMFGALAAPVDGRIYGIAGTGDTAQVFSYDLSTADVVLYGAAFDADRNTSIFRPHELVLGPNNCLYCPETDNPDRQCYFWETQLG